MNFKGKRHLDDQRYVLKRDHFNQNCTQTSLGSTRLVVLQGGGSTRWRRSEYNSFDRNAEGLSKVTSRKQNQ